MHERDRYGIEQRLRNVIRERSVVSADRYVDDLEPLPQPVEGEYFDEVWIDGDPYYPFLFTKGMPLEQDSGRDRLKEGLVPAERKLDNYLEPIRDRADLSEPETFERGDDRLFIGYPAVYTVGLAGMEAWRGRMPEPPAPTGPENAGELIDVYAMEQFRDTPFVEWPNEPGGFGEDIPADVQNAVERDLADIREESPDGEWWYTADRLFVEADTDEMAWGPYLSQFLLRELKLWAFNADQTYLRYPPNTDYNDDRTAWLDNLEGEGRFAAETEPNKPPSGSEGYIATPRHLATIVNAEPPYQEYLIATIQLLGDADFDPGLPYTSRSEGPVFDYTGGGPVGLLDMVARAGRQALLAAFYQKYYAHFRCRPETYAGRVHAQVQDGRGFGLDPLVEDSAVRKARDSKGEFLSTAYREGSPVHPAYPSGHSVIAGACGTVLKTWFADQDWPFEEWYVPTPSGDQRENIDAPDGHNGLYQEIDKLMSNVGLARMFAGVHYYSDHYEGVKLGEQVAVGLLADVFGRNFDGVARFSPSFKPYLEYGDDAARDIDPHTLEELRREALARRDR